MVSETAVASFGVAIPTHNGSRLLARSMLSLAEQEFDGDLHVVVAVNDGRPDSMDTARRLAQRVRDVGRTCTLIRTAAGRAAALREADRHLPVAPRLYLDQDAVLSRNSIAELAAALAPGSGVHFAVPGLRLAPCRSRFTRAYYRVWSELPYVRLSPVTCGAYAVSVEGRARWGELPTIHSDDKWVRWHFAPWERLVLVRASYEVVPPDGVQDLLAARHRYDRGNQELSVTVPVPPHVDDMLRHRGVLGTLVRHPTLWPAAACFLAIHVGAAIRGSAWSRP